jgi:hypothetical protein
MWGVKGILQEQDEKKIMYTELDNMYFWLICLLIIGLSYEMLRWIGKCVEGSSHGLTEPTY